MILYDDYVEFQANCAFLCDAIASLASQEEQFDMGTVLGIKQFCQFVKERSEEFGSELNKLVNQA